MLALVVALLGAVAKATCQDTIECADLEVHPVELLQQQLTMVHEPSNDLQEPGAARHNTSSQTKDEGPVAELVASSAVKGANSSFAKVRHQPSKEPEEDGNGGGHHSAGDSKKVELDANQTVEDANSLAELRHQKVNDPEQDGDDAGHHSSGGSKSVVGLDANSTVEGSSSSFVDGHQSGFSARSNASNSADEARAGGDAAAGRSIHWTGNAGISAGRMRIMVARG